MFTPRRSACQLVVNLDKSIADGTLLITWQERAETINGFYSITLPKPEDFEKQIDSVDNFVIK